ncbi:MAG: hypothetical protein K8M05_12325 [Deltaproteobacteria bacterium]|nr:hypothetical protein [Kofleriaceae bacterium]
MHVVRRASIVLALAAVALAAHHRDAGAVCSTRHLTVFEIHDTATLVAVVSVTRAPKPMSGGGDVDLVIHERLKGAPARTARARENAACTAGFYNVLVGKVAKTALVFIGADGEAVGYWSGVEEQPTPELMTAMRDWSQAADDAARVEILVTAIESSDAALGADAAYYLADEPRLLLRLDPAQVDRVAAKAGGDQWGPEIILTRLHGAHLKALRRRGGLPKDLAAIAKHDLERVSRPESLARIIERDRDPRSYRKVAALERCERVHGRRLERFSIYNSRYPDRARWRQLARACRTGTPLTSSRRPSPSGARRA